MVVFRRNSVKLGIKKKLFNRLERIYPNYYVFWIFHEPISSADEPLFIQLQKVHCYNWISRRSSGQYQRYKSRLDFSTSYSFFTWFVFINFYFLAICGNYFTSLQISFLINLINGPVGFNTLTFILRWKHLTCGYLFRC